MIHKIQSLKLFVDLVIGLVISVFRNHELKLLLLVQVVISLCSVLIANNHSTFAGIVVFVTTSILIFIFLIFTVWRYRVIKKLSTYLRKISSGDYSLDLRDNREGELSILKNEIYKVTLKLSEQHSVLQNEKVKLTEAISDISHQLKTPLTSMVVMSDLLSNPSLPIDKRAEFTQCIQLQLERIDWLVSSLLKLSKIDAGAVRFERERVVVNELLRKAVAPLLIPIDIKEQILVVNGDDSTTFIGDENWTQEALINMVKNCVEHTPHGGTIHISFSENALFTEINITDSGEGITKEELPFIFKRFYKGKNASDESVGIGLAMAHAIIKSQNGTIDVKSDVGKGTTFMIKFYKKVV